MVRLRRVALVVVLGGLALLGVDATAAHAWVPPEIVCDGVRYTLPLPPDVEPRCEVDQSIPNKWP